MKILGLGLVVLSLLSCSSTDRRNTYRQSDPDRPLVDEKYSLSADRKAMDEYRKEVPESKKLENDEIALVLNLFSDLNRKPSDIRNAFDSALRKKRDLFQKDMSRERESFTKSERKSRDEFLKQMDQERKDFQSRKASKEERQIFYNTQDEKRKDYFSNQKEKREDFESDSRERRKSFEDYAREKRDYFESEYKSFIKKVNEDKKEKSSSIQKNSSSLEFELQSYQNAPATFLGVDEE